MRSSFAVEKLHTNLGNRMEKRYTEMNDSVTDVNLAYVDETTYGEYLATLSNPTITFTFTVAGTEGDHWNNPCVWSYANTVGHEFLKFQDQTKTDGPLNAEERNILGKVITADLKDFETVWGDVASTQISDAELETNPDYAKVMTKEESIILVAWECHMQHANGLITLAYQKSGIESVVSQLSSWAA